MFPMQPSNTAIQLNTQNLNLVETPSEVLRPCNLNECNTFIGKIQEIHKPTNNNCLSWNLLFSGKGFFKLQFDQNLKIVTLLTRNSGGYSVIKKGTSLLNYKPEEPQIPQEKLPCNTTSKSINFDDKNKDKNDVPCTITHKTIMENNNIETNNYKFNGIYPSLSNGVKKIHVFQIPEFEYYNLNYESCIINRNINNRTPHIVTINDEMDIYKYIHLYENKSKIEFDNNCETSSRYLPIHELPVPESLKKSNNLLFSAPKYNGGEINKNICRNNKNKKNCLFQHIIKSHSYYSSNEIRKIFSNVTESKLTTEDKYMMDFIKILQFRSPSNELFDNPFPKSNPFKVGQVLEGIDPKNATVFCILTVIKLQGYRILLHFNGYSQSHDVWVNADHPYLFPPKWCEKNSRTLQPPKNYSGKFDWTSYLEMNQFVPSPKSNFASNYKTDRCIYRVKQNFRIGYKLEALGLASLSEPTENIHVATIVDVINQYIRIEFDGWPESYSYWTDISSTNIFPINWCNKNNIHLCAPRDYSGRIPFSWITYLRETNSKSVPENAFSDNSLKCFTVNMTVEVVDLIVPSIFRIAEIVDVKGSEIQVLYDGFDPKYAYWIQAKSSDIHPVGWCFNTDHPIEIPPMNQNRWRCNVTKGCNGKYSLNRFENDHILTNDECPYKYELWKMVVDGTKEIPNRLNYKNISVKRVEMMKTPWSSPRTKKDIFLDIISKCRNLSSEKILQWLRKHNKPKANDYRLYVLILLKNEKTLYVDKTALQTTIHYFTFDTLIWTPDTVVNFINILLNPFKILDETKLRSTNIRIPECFLEKGINGRMFLKLTHYELTEVYQFNLFDAVKIACSISMIKEYICQRLK